MFDPRLDPPETDIAIMTDTPQMAFDLALAQTLEWMIQQKNVAELYISFKRAGEEHRVSYGSIRGMFGTDEYWAKMMERLSHQQEAIGYETH